MQIVYLCRWLRKYFVSFFNQDILGVLKSCEKLSCNNNVCRASVFYFGILVVVVFLEHFTVLPFFSISEDCVVKILLG